MEEVDIDLVIKKCIVNNLYMIALRMAYEKNVKIYIKFEKEIEEYVKYCEISNEKILKKLIFYLMKKKLYFIVYILLRAKINYNFIKEEKIVII